MDKQRALMAVSEINVMGHDVFFPLSDRNIKAYDYREGSVTKLELERCWSIEEMMVKVAIVDHPNWREGCSAAGPTKEALLQPLVSVGGSSGESRRDLPDSRRWTVGRKTSGPRRAREDRAERAIVGSN